MFTRPEATGGRPRGRPRGQPHAFLDLTTRLRRLCEAAVGFLGDLPRILAALEISPRTPHQRLSMLRGLGLARPPAGGPLGVGPPGFDWKGTPPPWGVWRGQVRCSRRAEVPPN
jgi:hypothetical protein